MKLALFFVALALGGRLAAAQSGPPAVRPDSLAASPADTAAALHRLFAAQRKKRGYVVGATGLLVGVGLIPSTPPGAIISQRAAVLFWGIPAVGAELLYYGAFSRRKEQRAVDAFRAHKLPPGLRRRLKARYFR